MGVGRVSGEVAALAGLGDDTADRLAWVERGGSAGDCADDASRVPFVDDVAYAAAVDAAALGDVVTIVHDDDEYSFSFAYNASTANVSTRVVNDTAPSARRFVARALAPALNATLADGAGVARARVTFNRSEASGRAFQLCYKFGREAWQLFPQFELQLGALDGYKAARGAEGVAVVGAPKRWTFSGAFVGGGDLARWVRGRAGDDDATEDSEYCGLNRTAALERGEWGLAAADTVATVGRAAEFAFASAAASERELYTLCWSFGGVEPWRRYALASTRVFELRDVEVDSGLRTRAVATARDPRARASRL